MKYQILSMPKNWLLVTLLVTVTLATSATTYIVARRQAVAQTPTPVSSDPISIEGVSATGYLEPEGEVLQLSAPAYMEGARVDQLLVSQGDRIKAGQVIAILDNRDRLQAALEQAEQEVSVARARLAQVEAGTKQGEINAQAARFEGTQAELQGQITAQRATIARLEAELGGERNAQQATLERLRAELQNAQTECGRYESLYQEGATSASQRDSTCLQYAVAQERVEEANANLARTLSTLQEQINEANANLNRTIATLENQLQENAATLDALAEVRPVDVQIAQAELQAAEAAVERAKADLALAYVRSPSDGQVLEIHTRPGELVGTDGIVEVGQTSQMYAIAEVYETDISRVQIGQQATISSDGIIGELHGTVDEIGLQIGTRDALGTDPVADADARVVEVKIRLTPEDSLRAAGLTNLEVNVVIDTATP
ncbi:MAG: ABC exporter membrane fusion protein [Cyanobacteria bacterium CRU_2_1]|nr:ABC exporter membrane fusion protein [Cyanobacteria bacterium CRU_2_1]